jgi:hypothetical protein
MAAERRTANGLALQSVPGGSPTRAADNLLALSLPIDQIISQDCLREIPGIGGLIDRHRHVCSQRAQASKTADAFELAGIGSSMVISGRAND